jgi:alginate O-acetyltransferase complex protein AlgI
VPVVYWLAPIRFRAAILATTSLLMLFYLAPYTVAFMLGLSLLVYFVLKFTRAPATANGADGLGVLPEKIGNIRLATWMFFAVLGYLAWYKYMPELVELVAPESSLAKIAVPLGISYFSFKLMHYALERSRGGLPPHNIQEFLSWMFLMPTFTSGPIERFDHFQISKEDTFRIGFVVEGLTRIAQGLVKRFVVMEQIDQLTAYLTGGSLLEFAAGISGQQGAWAVWAFLFLSLISLYLDFSAYSDIAIGASRLFGLKIIENFNYPLLATNIGVFWQRWHISLTAWCRAYVYMPVIGITRNPYIAVIATFTLVGIWHAGTIHWLSWGLWHGCGLALAQRWSRFAQRRKFQFFKTPLGKFTGWGMTIAYVSLGDALLVFTHEGTFMDSFRLMARAFGL